MQSIIALALGFLASTALAQGTQGLPPCAAECVNEKQNGQQGYGGCTSLDIKCICTQGSFIADLACCVSTKCDAAGQEATIQFANAICGSEDAASALPTTATCASTAASSGTAAATMSMGSMTAGETMSMGTMTSAPAASGTSGAAAGTTKSAAADMLNVQGVGAGIAAGIVGLVAAL
ncbi:unnamed protein product [Zymoseptoria tritici ST99CH_1A5]|uniref:CFEM domain-containing protein n=3 Tax=Zymoseptoria tritici TaxID=1047171 RepID=F9XEP7_ZYMTI|nr:uncharacterized protein MYCGRDRAFT_94274 [Zymoseptoria tritici IPO323]EGP86250.1 hypothetical protein MYCGRDRAFT_94274 [Zymoseptoria tritici IPO323]SMR55044.1 unnamed protein product [Zymoseptoria tritici ST99CH_1E4]SMR57430.1 unnamed protein product [Zymoseptoria tritici ST99CH_3D1]SMY25869.1 unnamed protein product [Zymoseptoria tritici ST99CH_1A5]